MPCSIACPLCDALTGEDDNGGDSIRFECKKCCGFTVRRYFLSSSRELRGSNADVLSAIREVHEKFNATPFIMEDGIVRYNVDGQNYTLTRFPKTIRDRAFKLLAAINRRVTYFGESVPLELDENAPLGYVTNAAQLIPYLTFLEELGHLRCQRASGKWMIKITARGIDNLARPLTNQTVFLSSTCDDLTDLRLELAEHLEANGCQVRLSESPTRFKTAIPDTTLQCCLQNVRQSNVVICVIDGRLGSRVEDGEFVGCSVTQAEVRFAKSQRIRVLYFIRARTFDEYFALKKDPKRKKTRWIEPHDRGKRESWLSFVGEIAYGDDKWLHQFISVVDLKSTVVSKLRELSDGFDVDSSTGPEGE